MIIKKDGLYLSWNSNLRKWELNKEPIFAFRFENQEQLDKLCGKYKINIDEYEKIS